MATSRARTSRPLTRKVEPCSRTIRRETSKASNSLKEAGALRSALSTMTETSAWLRDGRSVLPEKMTSSISAARMALYEASPMTQRTASTRFDLPQPFGPTTPVRPGSMAKSVGSTKDLKPIRRSRVSFILYITSLSLGERRIPKGSRRGRERRARDGAASARRMNRRESERNQGQRNYPDLRAGSAPFAARTGPGPRYGGGKKPLSCLEIGVNLLGQLVDRLIADQLLAIDEKSWRRIDAELLGGVIADDLEALEELLIRQTVVEFGLAYAELLGDLLQRRQGLLDDPFGLLGEQGLHDGHVSVLAAAARQHESRGRERIEREGTQGVADLAGVDVTLLQLGKRGLGKMRAMRAGHRGIFDDGHRRLVGPDHDVAVRPRIGKIGGRGIVVGRGGT